MAYNKTAVAGGMVVGMIIVAGILQVKFYFNPPKDNFDNEIDFLLDRQMALLADSIDDAPFADSVDALSVTPTESSQPIYGDFQTITLSTGIPLASLTETAGVSSVVLRGNQLLLMQYDQQWQVRPDGEHVLMTEISLVNGKAPLASLTSTPNGYQLLITQPTAVGTIVKVISIDEQFAVTTTNSLAVDPVVMAATGNTLWSYTVDAKLQIYSIAEGTLVAEQTNTLVPCNLITDGDSVIVLSAQSDQLLFSKISAVGETRSKIIVSAAGITSCVVSGRLNQHLAVVLPNTIQLFNDNLTVSYPAVDLPTNALFPLIGFSGEQLWVMYSTSETLGEYQFHVAMYDPLAVVTQPDAANVYTN